MKTSFIHQLKCPNCSGSFSVDCHEEAHGEIKTGVLTCDVCRHDVPVHRYIPRFVAKQNYSHSWGKLWEETGPMLRDSYTGIPFHRNVVHGSHDESGEAKDGSSPFGFSWPEKMATESILEIGPGTGNCTEVLVETGANLVCVDMSHAIDTLPEELLTRPNLNVVQADINGDVLRQGIFDRIWLFQVLQHTPSPPDTLRFVRNFLRPGGELAVTSYSGSFNPWYYRHTKRIDDERAWKMIKAVVPAGVRLKYGLMRLGDRWHVPKVKGFAIKGLGFIDPRNIYYKTLTGQMNDYLMGTIWEQSRDRDLLMKHVVINTYDAITPSYTNSCKDLATMESWLHGAGYASFEVWGKAGVRAKAWTDAAETAAHSDKSA